MASPDMVAQSIGARPLLLDREDSDASSSHGSKALFHALHGLERKRSGGSSGSGAQSPSRVDTSIAIQDFSEGRNSPGLHRMSGFTPEWTRANVRMSHPEFSRPTREVFLHPLPPHPLLRNDDARWHRENFAVGSSRQNTTATDVSNRTQDSHASSSSSGSTRTPGLRQISLADRDARLPRAVSRMSLPEFRNLQPQLFWPLSNGQKGARILATHLGVDPNQAFKQDRQPRGVTDKSFIFPAVVMTEDGKAEHLALKVVPCDHEPNSPGFETTVQQEYNVLASIRHNHIIAAVGHYIEGNQGNRDYGLLLFPLAEENLYERLCSVSFHNSKKTAAEGWAISPDVYRLLEYVTCLCRAVIYLHGLKQPIKHRDIKSANILIDAHKTVVLADFDIAKKYTNRDYAVTSEYTLHTERYSSKAVKDGEDRSFDSDIYSLGCVFLEIATVAFGQTLRDFWLHLAKGKTGQFPPYSKALEEGTILTWIAHLKRAAKQRPAELPLHLFGEGSDMQSGSIDEFFRQILIMLHTTKDTYRGVLERAEICFDRLSRAPCVHCHPKYDHSEALLSVPSAVSAAVKATSSVSRKLASDTQPGAADLRETMAPIPENVSGASSIAGSRPRSPSLRAASEATHSEQKPVHHLGVSMTPAHEAPSQVIEHVEAARDEDAITERVPVSERLLDRTADDDDLRQGQSDSPDAGDTPKVLIHKSSTKSRHSTRSASQQGIPAMESTSVPSLADTQELPRMSGASSFERDTASLTSMSTAANSTHELRSDVDASEREHLAEKAEGSNERPALIKITATTARPSSSGKLEQVPSRNLTPPRSVRVLVLSPKHRRALTHPAVEILDHADVFRCENDQLHAITELPKADEGVFIEVCSNRNASVTLPHPKNPGMPGETLTPALLLSWVQRITCWAGRTKLIFVPGEWTDEQLKRCMAPKRHPR